MSSIRLENLSKVYSGPGGDIVAVNDVNIDIEDGEFIVLVGPSGSGKSTILRMIAGLETVTDGRILIDDEDITDRKPKNRDIAMVFQNYSLYPHLTARKNMSFGLKMRGELSSEEIDERVENAASIMSITDLLDKMPDELSGGQKQRIALGRAIVRDPQAFLMDEPLSNLDAKLRTQMRTEIQLLQNDLDVTTIYVTHDQTEAMTMGDRIAILDGGELQQMATPLEAYYKPNNRFVAGFIGSPSMNFIDVNVDQSGELSLEHEAFSYETSPRIRDAVDSAIDRMILGIRPEDIEVADESTENTIEVTVDVIEPLGKEQMIYFSLDGETYTGSVSGHRNIPEGGTVHLRFPTERVHLFDHDTSESILNCVLPEEDEAQQFNAAAGEGATS
ncbi:ABC transporter ATP-binding protein [Natrinema gelatinilyticum]|uniref:ABC transporter ATP-binding protein n=1 Tax=Natrinema gelatinilyticum TaxID=2961571 RepID=UPI0020C4B3D7|nr:ABC transporter ATP-binding protein [Natrinema gelatinilyticum]